MHVVEIVVCSTYMQYMNTLVYIRYSGDRMQYSYTIHTSQYIAVHRYRKDTVECRNAVEIHAVDIQYSSDTLQNRYSGEIQYITYIQYRNCTLQIYSIVHI